MTNLVLMNDVFNLVESLGLDIESRAGGFSYFEIASFRSIEFSYGVHRGGWLVVDRRNVISIGEHYSKYVPFLRVLELSPKRIIEKLDHCAKDKLEEGARQCDSFHWTRFLNYRLTQDQNIGRGSLLTFCWLTMNTQKGTRS